jgi:Uma2 family endonuclease
MEQTVTAPDLNEVVEERTRWTSADMELLPHNGVLYEIIDGELFMSHQPHVYHQTVSGRIFAALDQWVQTHQRGLATLSPGVLFTDVDDVAPDVAWISDETLQATLDEAGHIHGAPELVVEILSPGLTNERRDRQAKLKLYEMKGVHEYWIVDWRAKRVEIYRRKRGQLRLINTLLADDEITTPLLPAFAYPVKKFFI